MTRIKCTACGAYIDCPECLAKPDGSAVKETIGTTMFIGYVPSKDDLVAMIRSEFVRLKEYSGT